MNCIACAGANTTQHERGGIAPFVIARAKLDNPDPRTCECNDCGTRWCSHRLTDAEAARLYEDYRGPTYNADREQYEPGYTAGHAHLNNTRDYLHVVEDMIVQAAGALPESVIDIGGAGGTNTPVHRTATVTVYDLDNTANRKPTAGRYDLVVLSHILEHVGQPRDLIAKARGLKHPEHGVIYAEVPLETFHDNWHEHCQQFTREGLVALFGGKVIDYMELATSLGPVRMVVGR